MENNLIKADYTTMPRMFDECNLKYFNHSLPRPKYGLMQKKHVLGRFECNMDKGKKHPIKWQKISFSECYDYTEEERAEILSEKLQEFFKSLHLKTTLRELSIDETHFEEMADRATKHGTQTVGHYVALDKEKIIDILKAAL